MNAARKLQEEFNALPSRPLAAVPRREKPVNLFVESLSDSTWIQAHLDLANSQVVLTTVSGVLSLPRVETTRDQDFQAWLLEQAAVLHAQRSDLVDWDALAEELEEMAHLARAEVVSRLAQILAHLLKWKYQPTRRTERSWKITLVRERQKVTRMLLDSTNLRNYAQEQGFESAYQDARALAGTQMNLTRFSWDSLFPYKCEWTFSQTLDEDFLPDRNP